MFIIVSHSSQSVFLVFVAFCNHQLAKHFIAQVQCGLIRSSAWLNMRSTGADAAGAQKAYSRRGFVAS